MSAEATIKGYMDAALAAEDDVLYAQVKVSIAQREVVKAQTTLVGARERAREAREVLRLAQSREVREEVSSRDVEIAHMKGIVLSVGDLLTPSVKALLRETPALPRFQND